MQTSTLSHRMRRAALLLCLALVASLWLAPTTFAQPDPEQMKARMAAQTDTLVKKLDLTTAQEEPVRAIRAFICSGSGWANVDGASHRLATRARHRKSAARRIRWVRVEVCMVVIRVYGLSGKVWEPLGIVGLRGRKTPFHG